MEIVSCRSIYFVKWLFVTAYRIPHPNTENIAVFVYHFAKVLKYKRNIAVGVHSDLGEYRELVVERDVQPAASPVIAPVPTVG